MSASIIWKGTFDIISSPQYGYNVISYTRTQEMCNGEGFLNIVLKGNSPHNYQTWETMVLYEGEPDLSGYSDPKIGTYYISSIETDKQAGLMYINCQDGSKRMADTFIDQQYNPETQTYAKQWIELFLDMAGVTYQFNAEGDGAPLSDNTSLGMTSVYDQVFSLLQISGWYFFFNANGVCEIGELDLSAGSGGENIPEETILSIRVQEDDKMLRNRAVVWGNGIAAPDGEMYWVFADLSTHTPWNYDENDVRTVVYANTMIPNNVSAYLLAQQILDTFSTITVEKTIQKAGVLQHYGVADATPLGIGNRVFVDAPAEYFRGGGLITTISSEWTADGGHTTTVILDQRCPRLFGFISWLDDYVYIGTWGAGVWRKQLGHFLWENWSDGLGGHAWDYYVEDLQISNGVAIMIAQSDFVYTRLTQDGSQWLRVTHPDMVDVNGNTLGSASIEPVAVTINKSTGDMYAAYRPWTSNELNRSWIGHIRPSGSSLDSYYQMFIDDGNPPGNYDVRVYDIDTDDRKVVAVLSAVLDLPGDDDECQPDIFTSDISPTVSGYEHADWDDTEYDEILHKQNVALAANPFTEHRRWSDPAVCANDIWVMQYERDTGDAYVRHYVQSQNPVTYTEYPSVGSFSVTSGTTNEVDRAYTAGASDDYVYFVIWTPSTKAYYVYKFHKVLHTLSSHTNGTLNSRYTFSIGPTTKTGNNWLFGSDTSSAPATLTAYAFNWIDGTEYSKPLYSEGGVGWLFEKTINNLAVGYGYAGWTAVVGTRYDDQSSATIDQFYVGFDYLNSTWTSIDEFNIWPAQKPDWWSATIFIFGDGSWVEEPSVSIALLTGTTYDDSGRFRWAHSGWEIDYSADLDPVDGTPEPYSINGRVRRELIEQDTDWSGIGAAGNIGSADYNWITTATSVGGIRLVYADTSQLNAIVTDNDANSTMGTAGNVRNGWSRWGGHGAAEFVDYYDGDFYYFDTESVGGGEYDINIVQVSNDTSWTTKTIDGILRVDTGAMQNASVAQNVAWARETDGAMTMVIFGPWDYVELSVGVLAYGNMGGFEIVTPLGLTHKIEVNKQTPVVTLSLYNERPDNKVLVWYPPVVSGVSFMPITPAGEGFDIRTFDLIQGTNFATSGGTYVPSGGISKHILLAVSGQVVFAPIRPSSAGGVGAWRGLTGTIGSGITKVETSNFVYPPHIFLAGGTSGTQFFYERQSEATTFTEYSAFLPNSEITVIRMDDRN